MTARTSEDKKRISWTAIFHRILPYMKKHWRFALWGSIFMVILSLLALPAPYLMKVFLDNVIPNKNLRLLYILIIILIGSQLLRVGFSFATNYCFNLFNQEIITRIKKDLFYRILMLPLSFYDKNQTGYLLSRIGEVDGLSFFFSNIFVSVLISFAEFILCLGILFYLNRKLLFISLVILPVYFFAAKCYSRRIRRISREAYEKGANVSRHIQDSLSGVDVVKCFTAEKREADKIDGYLNDYKRASIKRNILFSLSSEAFAFLGVLGGAIILLFSGLDIISGVFTIGGYVAFSAYVGRLYGPTQMFANFGLTIQPAAIALERISELMDIVGEDSKGGIEITRISYRIEFKNVSFSYGDRTVLSGVNFGIEHGEEVLISGPNGSGKSTLIKLLLGLYSPTEGSIFVNGVDLKEIAVSSLRRRISIVSQNTFLFNDSIRNNILYSRPEATEPEILQAAKESGAIDFIERQEKGFDTEIGERGIRLSGGEKQKISIARAILKASDVLILDEAATHLDNESENALNDLFESKFGDKTRIIISHKVPKLKGLSSIFVMNDGKLTIKRIYS